MLACLRVVTALVVAAGLHGGSCRAAEVRVFSDGPLRGALSLIAADFRSHKGHDITVVYGTAPALRAKLAAGEKADVLISLAPEVAELAAEGRIATVQTSVASIKLGLAVRKGAVLPDIKTLEGLKRTLQAADAIIHNDLASGRAFVAQLEKIGLLGEVRTRIVAVKGNGQLGELAKRGGNDIASGQLTQIIADASVQLVGALPAEAQAETVYSAGVFSDAQSRDAAMDLVRYLTTAEANAIFAAAGAK